MRIAFVLVGALIAASLCEPAAARPVTAPDRVEDAATQPLRDLSLVRRRVPPVLRRALTGPYDAPAPTSCPQIAAEIAELDTALGPDFDSEGGIRRTGNLRSLAVDGVRSVVNLPFRGIIRVITGARRRDEVLQSAILAGVSRRAFLKGLQRAMACDSSASPLTVAAEDASSPIAAIQATPASDETVIEPGK